MPAEKPAGLRFTRPAWSGWWIVFLGTALFGLRLVGPADLTDNDQERPASYVLDAVQNGHWLIQRDAYDDIASKPPLFTWLAGLATVCAGRISRLTLYLPSAVGVVGMAWLVWAAGRAHFGSLAGLLAGLSLVLSQYGFKHVVLARNDALFAGAVSLAALAAWRAWTRGRGWTAFWLAAAAATLAKGPLGLLLAAGGLLAAAWERGSARCPVCWKRLLPGAGLWLALVGGWFFLAWLEAGDDLIHKQLGRELAGHLTGAEAGGKAPFSEPWLPLLYFLSRYAPWSLAAGAGLWRVWRRPAEDVTERRFERFLFCWFAVGLVVFSVAPHKRPDLLLPVIPAAALLAGRELAGWLRRWPAARVEQAAALGSAVVLAGLALGQPQGRATATEVLNTRAQRELAAWWEETGPAAVPLTFVEHTLTAQFYLNRHQAVVTPEQAARLLQGDAACALITRDLAAVRRFMPADFEPVVLREAPAGAASRAWLLANRAATNHASGPVAVGVGPLRVRLEGATLVRARRWDLELRRTGTAARVHVVHDAPVPIPVGVIWLDAPEQREARRRLAPGETWTLTAP
jgi:hypothetical protein